MITEKNWFETQQSDDVGQDEGHAHGEAVMPSCPAGPVEGEKICDVCHEPFEQFYNEETEEWHLRPAVRVEDSVYHPVCYEDYQLSLTLDESRMAEASQGEEEDREAGVKTEVKEEESDVKEEEKNSKSLELVLYKYQIVMPPTLIFFPLQWTNRQTMTMM